MTDYMKPPWGLSPEVETRLSRHIEAKEWASAETLLRQSTTMESDHPWRLLALAEIIVNHALAATPGSVAAACVEAKGLIGRGAEIANDRWVYDVIAPYVTYLNELLAKEAPTP